jgi:hypothetical protein
MGLGLGLEGKYRKGQERGTGDEVYSSYQIRNKLN